MNLISAFAQTFQVTEFDIIFFIGLFIATLFMYYYWSLQRIYSIAFGAMSGIGVYVLLSVLLLGNAPLGAQGWLFPFEFSVVLISIAVYAVFVFAILFPLRWGLVISETTNQMLYIVQYIFVTMFLLYSLFAVMIYMIEQRYIFQVGTIFVWFRDNLYYQQAIRVSAVFRYIITHQNIIIPLGVLLMLYKLFLGNIISAIVLSIVYNLSNMSLYRGSDEDRAYRVEFHEVGASTTNQSDASASWEEASSTDASH